MKKEYLFNAIQEVKPNVLIGIPKVHLLKKLKKDVFSSIRISITTGSFSLFAKSIYKNLNSFPKDFDFYVPKTDELAAILYTSGGTGKPKGVEYTHQMFIEQTNLLKSEFNLAPSDIDIPGFPLFSFFTLSIGMTSCIPDMDFSTPAECDPAVIYKNIEESRANFLAGSPAIWERLADYCLREKKILKNVKHVVMFGAPVSLSLHRKFQKLLPQGTTYTPYGATECLPISNIDGTTLFAGPADKMQKGFGICVGKPLKGVRVKIIKILNEDISIFDSSLELSNDCVGEILVSAPHMTQKYHQDDTATDSSKIFDPETHTLWHRMGDVGSIDAEGQIWYCGRKSHVVYSPTTLYPSQVEAIFNQHPKVKRSALIKDPHGKGAAMAIETFDHRKNIDSMFLVDLRNLGQSTDAAKHISKFYALSHFPVDTRHNIKIDRLKITDMIKDSQ